MNHQICKHCAKPLIRRSEMKEGDSPCHCYSLVPTQEEPKQTTIKHYDRRPDQEVKKKDDG